MVRKIFFIFTLLIILPLCYIKAEQFPNEISAGATGGVTRYGFSMTTIATNVNGDNINGFCTKWQREAPIGGTTCYATKWSNDENKNKKISAAIGSIIKSFRASDKTVNMDNYFYIVASINRFLYEINPTENKYNYIAPSNTVLNKIKPYVENAKKVYNNYGNDIFKISEFKFNGINVPLKGDSTVKINSGSTKYIISTKMDCYSNYDSKSSKYIEQIKCDKPSVIVSATNAGVKVVLTNARVKTSTKGKSTIISIDLSDYKKSIIDNTIINIQFSNQKKYQTAQNYNCGSNYQTVTPNYIPESLSNARTINKDIKVEMNTTDQSCDEQISDIPSDNVGLYKKFKKAKIIDSKDPKCEDGNFTEESSCEQIAVTMEKVNQDFKSLRSGENDSLPITDEKLIQLKYGDGVSDKLIAFCRFDYVFDNLSYENKEASFGDLLYSSKENDLFGKAIVNYDCDIPIESIGDSGNDGYFYFKSVNQLIPKLSMKVDYKDNTSEQIEFLPNTKNKYGQIVSFVDDQSGCEILEGGFIVNGIPVNGFRCKSTDNGHKLKFSYEIDYKYGDNNKYSVASDGTLKKWQEGENLYGYGILATDDIKEIFLSFNTISVSDHDTIFTNVYANQEERNKEITASCDFSILPSPNIKKELKYRTINVNSPFTNYDGSTRYTGGNWCSDTVDNNTINMQNGINNDGIIPNNAKYCNPSNSKVRKYITNRPNANGKTPIYSFTITPQNIKDIREDNKKEGYNKTLESGKASGFVTKMINGAYASNVRGLCVQTRNNNSVCDVSDTLKSAGVISEDDI